jgi:hypothetical protein
MLELNETIARKVLDTVDAGLVNGKGVPIPGQMCVEAAVCFAYGLPHSDEPPCVGAAVRRFKIRLNDSRWSSDEARTQGMRKLAIAQLGSDAINQQDFAKLVCEGTIRQIVPIAMRAAAAKNPKHAEALEAAAVRCEQEGTVEASRAASDVARAAPRDAHAAAYAAAAYAADADAAAAAAYAADAAAAAAYAAAYAADAAADAAAAYAADANHRDYVLGVCAEIGLQALITLKSPGCEYLWLCD